MSQTAPCPRTKGLLCTVALCICSAAVALGAPGCDSAPKTVPLAQPFLAEKHDLEYTMRLLTSNADRWTNLTGTCDIDISSPRIDSPGHVASLQSGVLTFVKPGSVKLVVPDSAEPSIRITGDGKNFRVDMPMFMATYTGKYADAVAAQPSRISFLPLEVANALEPTGLLFDKAPMLTQLEQRSGLYGLSIVTTPTPAIKPTGLVVMDRKAEKPVSVEEYYLTDGSLRARIVYLNFQSVPVSGSNADVLLPAEFMIVYPEEQTTIHVTLRDVKLNGKINPAIFKVSG